MLSDKFTILRMVPIFEDGNNKKDRPSEDDLFDRSSHGLTSQTIWSDSSLNSRL